MIRSLIATAVVAGLVFLTGALMMAAGESPEGSPDVKTKAPAPITIEGVYTLTPYGQKVHERANGTLPALETATFGAGCFWGVEARFRALDGVVATAVGYAGGHTDKPTYKQVCGDSTGHAEVVEVKFDPGVVTYESLLTIFWNNHNPTQLNYQGPDVGTQYRSAIFYHSDAQKAAAEKSKTALAASGVWKRPIVTEITKASTFFAAEDYHQQYLEKRGQTSCGVPSGH